MKSPLYWSFVVLTACFVVGCAGEKSEDARRAETRPPANSQPGTVPGTGVGVTPANPVPVDPVGVDPVAVEPHVVSPPVEAGDPTIVVTPERPPLAGAGMAEIRPDETTGDGPTLFRPMTTELLTAPASAGSSPNLGVRSVRPMLPMGTKSMMPMDVASVRSPDETAAGTTLPIAKSGETFSALEHPTAEPLESAMPEEAQPEETAVAEPKEPAAEPASEAAAATQSQDDGFARVKVYYGTDRSRTAAGAPSGLAKYPWQTWMLVAAGGTIFLATIAIFMPKRRTLKRLTIAGAAVTVCLGGVFTWSRVDRGPSELSPAEFYGNQRGTFELGCCEVSIPENHTVGELETTSVFRLDFVENPQKHVVLLGVTPQSEEEFFADCRAKVAQSQRQEAFVFVHGFNVSFEDAARRTAQMAYDLQFDGAPFFFSWPSQSGLLQYTVDETNVVWTVPHLKEFLLLVAQQTGAKSVHLIAHSMGNRALTSALYNLSYELGERAKIFHDVVLTAPDIDADVFRRDIAPAIVKTAQRVTLYASSNDEALALSKTLHGYPRAGDSGSGLLVVPGIDTIDVSAVDTSLLGHSYYGSNDTVLADLAELLLGAKSPQQRPWLQSVPAGPLNYWVLLRERIGSSPGASVLR